MANNEFVEILTASSNAELKEAIANLNKIADLVKQINKDSKNISLPSQSRTNTNQANGTTRATNQSLSEQERLIRKISDARKADAIELAKLRLELANLNKENKKAAQEALGVLSSYQKLSAELNSVRAEAKSLAADMFLLEQAGEKNSDQYRELAASYDLAARRVNLLNDGLTRIDRDLGDHRRNVGNYESGWNGLGNAINQLTREAPAFANSIQTGFMAISNNIPAIADALADLTNQNARLRAEGQPTVSVLRQLGNALFSWQTLLSAGVTVLTIYGKEIVNWVSSLFTAKKALDSVSQAQATLNKIKLKSEKDIIDEITSYRLYLSTARDVTKSLEERQIAVKKLQDEYAFYFGKLTEQQILTGQTTQAEIELNKALDARSNVAGISDAYNKNQQKIIDLEHALGRATKTVSQEFIRQNELRKEHDRTGRDVTAELEKSNKAYNVAAVNLEKLTPQLQALGKAQQLLIKSGIEYKKASIGLEFNPEQEEAIKLQTEALKDFAANEYELIQTRLRNQSEASKRVLENEEVNYNDREQALSDYHAVVAQMNQNQLQEELRLIEQSSAEEIAALKKRAKDGEITERNANAVIYTITRQAYFDRLKAQEDFNQRTTENEIQNAELLKGVYDKINFQKANNIIDNRDVETTQNYTEKIKALVEANEHYLKIEEAQKEFAEANKQITKDRIETAIQELETEKAAIADTAGNVEKRLELDNKILAKKKELADATKAQAEEEAAALAKQQKAIEAYLNTFKEGFFQEAGLPTLFKALNKEIAGFGENFAVTFNTVTQIAQEAFAFLQQNEQARFDAMYGRLEQEKEIALRFAGESESGRAEIERQYEERRRQIRIKEAKAQKEQALFNIILNTAQGVTAALASIPPNVPLSLIIGAIGAAQLALVAGREIPAYADGVQGHTGGLAWVGDGGRSEIIQTPSGGLYRTPATDTLVNLPKGSNVYKDDLDFIRNSGALFGGVPHIELEGGGLTEGQMRAIMQDALSGSASFNVSLDKKGVNSWASTAHAKKMSHNNRVSFRGRSIG